MDSTTTFDRPSCPISRNWADDDEDDFDYDTWLAEDDRTSAPAVSSLPPFQVAPAEEEAQFAVHGAKATTEAAPWAQFQDTTAIQHQLPDKYECSGAVAAAHRLLRNWDNSADKPAFWELSRYETGEFSPLIRIEYSCNWKKMKVEWGLDCRNTASMRMSKMCEVETIEHEEDIPSVSEHEMHVQTPTSELSISEPEGDITLEEVTSNAQPSIIEDFDNEYCVSPTPSELPKLITIDDEGYYSDTSRLQSPTKSQCEEVLSLRLSSPNTPLYDIGNRDKEVPSFMEYAIKAAATSWARASNMSWTTGAIVGASVLAGAGMWLARRR